MRSWLNPATMVTLLRVGLTPLVAQAIAGERHLLALLLFFVAALTDALDGALARRFTCITTLGAYLDPIADKLLLSTVYICLAFIQSVPWWFVAVVFGRDLLILAGAGAALCFTQGRKFPPSVWGKFSTFMQILTAVVWMARNVLQSKMVEGMAGGLLWATAVATVWSGLHYGWRAVRLWPTH
jgi:cardiolipin synthase (CMP-forming)